MDSELLLKITGYLGMYLGIYWVFPRLPFGIVAYAFTLILDNLCRNSCISKAHRQMHFFFSILKHLKILLSGFSLYFEANSWRNNF